MKFPIVLSIDFSKKICYFHDFGVFVKTLSPCRVACKTHGFGKVGQCEDGLEKPLIFPFKFHPKSMKNRPKNRGERNSRQKSTKWHSLGRFFWKKSILRGLGDPRGDPKIAKNEQKDNLANYPNSLFFRRFPEALPSLIFSSPGRSPGAIWDPPRLDLS